MFRPLLFIVLLVSIPLIDSVGGSPGIAGQKAPEWQIKSWIDDNGKPTNVRLADYKGKVVYILCFQSWCPGCHSVGFPTLKQLVKDYEQNHDVAFVSIQTVFEGSSVNTIDKVRSTQLKYSLKIPMGHDPGSRNTGYRSSIMSSYRTGGTPWVIIIDKQGKVVFNDFHIRVPRAKSIINGLLNG